MPGGRDAHRDLLGHQAVAAQLLALPYYAGAAGTVLYSSGVAAIAGALLAVLKAGDVLLVTDNAYEPSRAMAKNLLADLGIETRFFDPLDLAGFPAKFCARTRAVLLERGRPGAEVVQVQRRAGAVDAVAHALQPAVEPSQTPRVEVEGRVARELGLAVEVADGDDGVLLYPHPLVLVVLAAQEPHGAAVLLREVGAEDPELAGAPARRVSTVMRSATMKPE